MKRREFILLIGGAAAWPFASRAQQPALPSHRLKGTGPWPRHSIRASKNPAVSRAKNVAIEPLGGGTKRDWLPAMAADLVHRQVTVIAATTTPVDQKDSRAPKSFAERGV